jgi:hypothetical protein
MLVECWHLTIYVIQTNNMIVECWHLTIYAIQSKNMLSASFQLNLKLNGRTPQAVAIAGIYVKILKIHWPKNWEKVDGWSGCF